LDNLITAHGLQIGEEWHTVCTTKVAEYCQLLFESCKLPSSVPHSGNHFLLPKVYQVICDLLQFPYWDYRIKFLTIKILSTSQNR